MALITPQQVKDYTDFPKVQERADAKLAFDITQAESDVFSYVGHRFTEPEYIPLPDEVKTALILLTEHYALIRTDKALVKGYTSEKLDDYSYTRKDGDVFVNKPEIANLLKSFVKGGSGGGVRLRVL